MPPRAVLFDFDGVIADTENIHVAAWQRTLAGLGWEAEATDELCARAVEIDDRRFLEELFAKRKIENGDVAGWVFRKQRLTVAMLADSPRVYPGVAQLVTALRGRVRLAVVSTTWRENITTVLEASGLADAFDTIVSKEDVQVTKPDPECYRLALSRLELDAADALAIEDSTTGLTAARGVGIACVAVGHRLPAGEWAQDAKYVPNLTGTAALLSHIGLS